MPCMRMDYMVGTMELLLKDTFLTKDTIQITSLQRTLRGHLK